MDNLHLFLSKQAHASIPKSETLHDAVQNLAQVIDTISNTDGERDELARDARWLLREIMLDRASDEVA